VPIAVGVELYAPAMEAVHVRRSRRAKRWRLEVPWGEPPRLTVPLGMTDAAIAELLRRQELWIARQRARQVPRLGLERRTVSESEARAAAREVLAAVAEEWAARMAVSYRRIRVGAQRTLWGSCSPNGSLSFNWRLVLAPHEILEYVVVHELCHLKVLDHSPRFWELVERHRPGWREQRDWLRDHGPELMAFRPLP
jgi:predicted metal-dependent hydrolase